MKFHPKYILIWFALMAVIFTMNAQRGDVSKGDKLYNAKAFYKAAEVYEKSLKKSNNLQERARLADCYLKMGRYKDAEATWAHVTKSAKAVPEHYFQYARILTSNGKYEDAHKWFKLYAEKSGDEAGYRFAEFCKNAPQMIGSEPQVRISNLAFNTKASEIGPQVFGNTIYYSSNRGRGFTGQPGNMAQGKFFYDMYTGEVNVTSFSAHKLLPKKINKRFHDGPGCISADGKSFYFTRSNLKGGKLRKGKDGINRLKILLSKKEGEKWSKPEVLPFNGDDFSCAHPFISPDGKTLYFSSDRPGGKGGSDIWSVERKGESWGTPVLLEGEVNTSRNEYFPTVDATGLLLFASEGHPGFGGLDIFSARNGGGSHWKEVTNMGYPLNTNKDDFCPVITPGAAIGYLASNRNGDDDIYRFLMKTPVDILVVDKANGKPLPDAFITLTDNTGKVSTFKTDNSGTATHYLDQPKDFLLDVGRTGYKGYREKQVAGNISPLRGLNLRIELASEYTLAIKVVDAVTKFDLQDVTVRLMETDGEEKEIFSPNGRVSEILKKDKDYTVVLTKRGYKPEVFEFTTVGMNAEEPITFTKELQQGDFVMIEGYTIDAGTKSLVPEVQIRSIPDSTNAPKPQTASTKTGKYFLMLPINQNYDLFGSRKGYFSSRVNLPIKDSIYVDTTLVRDITMVKFEVGALVKMIYFEFKKFNVEDKYRRELTEIAYFLLDNPDAIVELSAHTDCRGNNSYNQKLSDQRAQASVDFIVGLGVPKERIQAKGYGESMPTNHCKDNVPCEEHDHQANRRCEVRIVSLDGKTLGMKVSE